MAVIAFDTIVNLVAFMAVGLFVILGFWGIGSGPGLPSLADNPRLASLSKPLFAPGIASLRNWVAISVLAGLAISMARWRRTP